MNLSGRSLMLSSMKELIEIETGTKLFEHLIILVQEELNNTDSGKEKKERVILAAKNLKDDLGYIAKGMLGWLLSIAVDVAYAWVITNMEES